MDLMKYAPLASLIEEKSDIIRLQYIQQLCIHMVTQTDTLTDEQRKLIRECTTAKLVKLCTILRESPWELAFREVTQPLAHMVESQYYKACQRYGVVVPRHVEFGMRIYYSCVREMTEEGHTCFSWTTESRKRLVC